MTIITEGYPLCSSESSVVPTQRLRPAIEVELIDVADKPRERARATTVQ
jgi:hypothetical protein